jgi:hypothetical protein
MKTDFVFAQTGIKLSPDEIAMVDRKMHDEDYTRVLFTDPGHYGDNYRRLLKECVMEIKLEN